MTAYKQLRLLSEEALPALVDAKMGGHYAMGSRRLYAACLKKASQVCYCNPRREGYWSFLMGYRKTPRRVDK